MFSFSFIMINDFVLMTSCYLALRAVGDYVLVTACYLLFKLDFELDEDAVFSGVAVVLPSTI